MCFCSARRESVKPAGKPGITSRSQSSFPSRRLHAVDEIEWCINPFDAVYVPPAHETLRYMYTGCIHAPSNFIWKVQYTKHGEELLSHKLALHPGLQPLPFQQHLHHIPVCVCVQWSCLRSTCTYDSIIRQYTYIMCVWDHQWHHPRDHVIIQNTSNVTIRKYIYYFST